MAVPTFQYATYDPEETTALSMPEPGAPVLWTVSLDPGETPGKGDRSRQIVRELISRYLAVPVDQVCLEEREGGKPYLSRPQNSALFFNLSHTGSRMVLLFSTDGEVGVDIERLDRSVQVTSIARHFFHPKEQAALAALPPDKQPGAFFRLWTGKEAFVKGIGTGLRLPTDAFYFVPDTGTSKKVILDATRLPNQKTLPEDLSSWRVYTLQAPSGTVVSAALTIHERFCTS